MNRDDELYLFFKTKQKVHEHFSIQLKNDHQKLIFEAKKPERALKVPVTSSISLKNPIYWHMLSLNVY